MNRIVIVLLVAQMTVGVCTVGLSLEEILKNYFIDPPEKFAYTLPVFGVCGILWVWALLGLVGVLLIVNSVTAFACVRRKERTRAKGIGAAARPK